MIVWQNGRLIPEEEVRISPFDPGFLVGRSVFETMLAVRGKVFAWPRHRKRFERSAEILGIKMPDLAEVESAMREVILANPPCCALARVRVTLTAEGNLLMTAKPVAEAPMTTTAIVVDLPINEKSPLSQAKSASYAENFLALEMAQAQGADEAIRTNTAGDLCEASLSNFFFVVNGEIRTPALETGCLAGVTREIILEFLPEIKEGRWPLSALDEASEIWLVSSMRRVQWVGALGQRSLGDEPSSRFLKVRKRLDDMIEA